MNDQDATPPDVLDRDQGQREIDAALKSILEKDAELLARLADA